MLLGAWQLAIETVHSARRNTPPQRRWQHSIGMRGKQHGQLAAHCPRHTHAPDPLHSNCTLHCSAGLRLPVSAEAELSCRA
jgi:hypothetical protein